MIGFAKDNPSSITRFKETELPAEFNRREHRRLPRSRYEKVIFQVLSGKCLKSPAGPMKPERMRGWHEVIFRNLETGKLKVYNLDELALGKWVKHEPA